MVHTDDVIRETLLDAFGESPTAAKFCRPDIQLQNVCDLKSEILRLYTSHMASINQPYHSSHDSFNMPHDRITMFRHNIYEHVGRETAEINKIRTILDP